MVRKATRGKDIIWLIQSISDTTGAKLPGIPVDGAYNREKEIFDEQTKIGRVVDYAGHSENAEMTLYAVDGDEGIQMIEEAFDNEEDIKVWRVNLNQIEGGGYNARFGYGVIESLEETDESEGAVELSTTIQIRGKMVKDVLTTIPQEILDLVNEIQYAFEQPDTGTTV